MLEFRIEEKDRGFQGEALTNDYLAAEYFLRSMGQSAEKISLFIENENHLQANDTLLVASSRISFDRGRSREMLDWVEKGGHLIITGMAAQADEVGRHDYILDELGVKIRRQEIEDEDEGEGEEDLPANLDVLDEEGFWQVDFIDNQEIVLAGDFTDDLIADIAKPDFQHEIIWSIVDNDTTYGVQFKLGQGHLTVLSDMKMFRNRYIDEYDHAAFLYSLSNVQAGFSQSGVFYYSLYEGQISLFQWLWNNAYLLMISILIVLVTGLWGLAPRFGPIINVHQPIRRRFLDHLSAAGNYHWRQGNYSYLLNEVRQQLSHQVKLKYPEWTNLSKNDQLNHFSDLSQLERPAIEGALFDTNVEHTSDFVNKVKTLEKLRKSL